jgi:hypothetical protein
MIYTYLEDSSTEKLYEIWKQYRMELSPQEINIIIGQLVSKLRKYEAKDENTQLE